jgi:hypothetical protein
MFKKIFGPKKVEGVGTPVPAEELRDALLDCFPKEGEINQYLTIEKSDKTHEGFTAAWEFFIRQSDDEGIKRNYLITEVYDPWYRQVRIGKLADMKAENIDKVRFFSSKKSLDPVVIQATNMGWDAYR